MESSTTIPASLRKSFADVWKITPGHAITHWYPATFYVLLPLIGKEPGLSYGQIGLVMTCQYVAGIAFAGRSPAFIFLIPVSQARAAPSGVRPS